MSGDLQSLIQQVCDQGFVFPNGRIMVGEFGDSKDQSTMLIGLIRNGIKRATAALQWAYEVDAEPMPQTGDLEIVVDDRRLPALVLRFTSVVVIPFDEVSAEFARAEGEGDLSIDYWRKEHWAFFSRECARMGRRPLANMPVLCLRFDLLHDCESAA